MRMTDYLRAGVFSGLAFSLLTACQSTGGNITLVETPSGEMRAFVVPPAPDSATAYSAFLVARYAALTDDPVEAAARYRDVLSTGRADADVSERAVFAALISGDFELAETLASKAHRAGAGDAALVQLVRAVDALREDRPRMAREIVAGSRLGPFNRLIGLSLSAWATLDSEGLDAARGELAYAASGDPLLDGVTQYMHGFLALSAGDDELARETFRRGWNSGLRLAIAAEAYARLLANQGEMRAAEDVVRTFRNEVGPNPAIEALGRDLAAGRLIPLNRPSIQEGAALAIYAPAAALSSQTGDDLAGVYFTLALALDPDLHVARTLWGDALDRAGRYDDAIEVLSGVPETSVFHANAQAQLAWVYRHMGEDAIAIDTATAALEYRPDRNLKVQLGHLFRSLERYEEAEEIFADVLAEDSERGVRDWRVYFARGIALERLGRWSEAERALRTSVALEPDQADVLNYLGYSLVDRGEDIPEAFDFIRRAVDLRPDAGHIVDSLGWAYYRLGQYEQAVVELERAAALSPGDPTINDHLGDAYWRVGRRLEARFQWQRALALLGDDGDDAAEIAAKLDSGLALDVAPQLATTGEGDGRVTRP